jgi:putative PIN family toxin of toxin-antitoxin system
MRIVLDTNVFVSGIFFSGPPSRILRAWRDEQLRLVYSEAILLEYDRVLAELSRSFPGINAGPFLDLLTRYGELVQAEPANIYCRDVEDVKFIDCLVHSKARCLVSGDKDLLAVNARAGLILTPRQFCDRHL